MRNNRETCNLIWLISVTLLFCVGAASQPQPSKPEKVTQAVDKVIVYYFHTNYRCYSCTTIERYTRECIETNFAKEIKSGHLEFKSVDIELPANKHYIEEYKLFTKSVIVSDMVQGKEQRWKNLQKVWEHLRNETKFKEYVKTETAAYLQEKRS